MIKVNPSDFDMAIFKKCCKKQNRSMAAQTRRLIKKWIEEQLEE